MFLVSFLALRLQTSSYILHDAFLLRTDHRPWVLWVRILSVSAYASRCHYAQIQIQQRYYHFLQRGKSNEIRSRLPSMADSLHDSPEYVKRLQESNRMLVMSICHPVRFQTWADTTITPSTLSFGFSNLVKTQPMLRSRYGSMVAQVHRHCWEPYRRMVPAGLMMTLTQPPSTRGLSTTRSICFTLTNLIKLASHGIF